MTLNLPGLIMGFREGLEAFLLIAIVLKYIAQTNREHLQNKIIQGVVVGLLVSLLLGLLLYGLSGYLGGVSTLTKLWESGASLVALILVAVFIVWMIKHGGDMASHVKGEVDKSVSANGLFWIALIIIAREGTEVAIFSFAGKYPADMVTIGLIGALLLTVLIFYSLIKVNLSLLFKITLVYLILQAGFLLGYSLHEGFSALKGYAMISPDSFVFDKAFNLSKTIFSHKDGVLGIPLHVVFGWYSKPEWVQFVIQYLFTFGMFAYWALYNKTTTK